METLDGVLGPAVGSLQRDTAVGQGRADVDDGAGVAGPHPVQRGHRAVDVAQVADLGDPLVLGGRDVLELGEDRGEGHVDPHVDGAEGLLGLFGGRFDLVRVGGVGGNRQGGATPGLDVPGRPGQAFLPPGPQGGLGPAGAEGRRGGPADTAAGPGDHDHLVFMLVAHEGAPFVVSKAVAAGVPAHGTASRCADSSSNACTKAWGALPRTCRWLTSYSSVSRPGVPLAARWRSTQRAASTWWPCWCSVRAMANPQSRNAPSAWPSGRSSSR